METDNEAIIANLKLLSTLQKYVKITTRESIFNEDTRWYNIPISIRRWNRQDNLNETVKKINGVVNAAIKHINNENDNVYDMKKYLKGAMYGITNLKETYSTCSQTCARLDVILDKMRKALDGYEMDIIQE